MSATPFVDYLRQTIKIGDWIMRHASSGSDPDFYFCKVVGLGSTGQLQVIPFYVLKDSNLPAAKDIEDHRWLRPNNRKVACLKPEQTWIIPEAALPKSLLKFINDALGGDVLNPLKFATGEYLVRS